MPQEVSAISPAGTKPENHPAFKWGIAAALLILTLLLGVGGYFGWKLYKSGSAPTATTPKSTPAPTPVATTSPPSQPSQPVSAPEKAEPAPVASSEATETVFRKATPPPEAKPESTEPPPLSSISSPVSTSVGPDVTAKTGVAMAVSNASPAFRSFIANTKITGVFQGRNPRAVINGRVTRVGDTVDHSLGITFHDIDPFRKVVVFKDTSGAIVTRKY